MSRRSVCPGREAVEAALAGNTLEAAAFQLNVAEGTLRRWRKELGIEVEPVARRPSNRPSAEEWALLCATHTSVELQAMFDVSWWTIWNWSKQLGSSPIGGAAAKRAPELRWKRAPKVEMPIIEISTRLHYWVQPNVGPLP